MTKEERKIYLKAYNREWRIRNRDSWNAYQRKMYRKKRVGDNGFVRGFSLDRSLKGRLEFWGCYTGDCIVWAGKISKDGYGHMRVNGKDVGAHRVAYELVRGAVPDGLEIDHLCRNRACINVAHLDAVTHSINVLRGESPAITQFKFARQTHCKRGHEFTPQNTRVFFQRGYECRSCRACDKARKLEQLAFSGVPVPGFSTKSRMKTVGRR